MSDPHRIIENDDDWVRAADTLPFVMPIRPGDTEDATFVRRKIAETRAKAGGLPEAQYLAACERAGIPTKEVWYEDPAMLGSKRRDFYVPTWAAPFLEATIARSAQQTRVLRRIAKDEEYRNAGVAIWRLSGLDALTSWIDNESKGTDT